jgi:aminoglycoside 3-N-acetyltransferase
MRPEWENPPPLEVDRRTMVTRSSLVRDLHRIGIAPGDVLLVHSSLSRLGFVVGAARTVIEALCEAVGPDGTIMMPTYSGELTDPANWIYPPVPPEWIEPIREETPPYDPQLTPTRRMGVIPELFRHYPGVRRSPHPQSSFAAWGRHAARLVDDHPLDFRFGPASPLGKLRKLRGKTLLLGAPPQTCSLFYLSQHYVPGGRMITNRSPLLRNGRKEWVSFRDYDYPNRWFNAATESLVAEGVIARSTIGDATCHLMDADAAIEAVIRWRLANDA